MAKKNQQQLDRFDTLKVHMHAATKLRTELGFGDPRDVELVSAPGPMLGLIRPNGLGAFFVDAFPPAPAKFPSATAATKEAAMVYLREASNSYFDSIKAAAEQPPAEIVTSETSDLNQAMSDYIRFLDS